METQPSDGMPPRWFDYLRQMKPSSDEELRATRQKWLDIVFSIPEAKTWTASQKAAVMQKSLEVPEDFSVKGSFKRGVRALEQAPKKFIYDLTSLVAKAIPGEFAERARKRGKEAEEELKRYVETGSKKFTPAPPTKEPTFTQKVARGVLSAPADVLRLTAATALTGGPIGAFALSSGAETAGEGGTALETLGSAATGAVTGAAFGGAGKLAEMAPVKSALAKRALHATGGAAVGAGQSLIHGGGASDTAANAATMFLLGMVTHKRPKYEIEKVADAMVKKGLIDKETASTVVKEGRLPEKQQAKKPEVPYPQVPPESEFETRPSFEPPPTPQQEAAIPNDAGGRKSLPKTMPQGEELVTKMQEQELPENWRDLKPGNTKEQGKGENITHLEGLTDSMAEQLRRLLLVKEKELSNPKITDEMAKQRAAKILGTTPDVVEELQKDVKIGKKEFAARAEISQKAEHQAGELSYSAAELQKQMIEAQARGAPPEEIAALKARMEDAVNNAAAMAVAAGEVKASFGRGLVQFRFAPNENVPVPVRQRVLLQNVVDKAISQTKPNMPKNERLALYREMMTIDPNDHQALQVFFRKHFVKPSDYVREYIYGSLLSGARTQMRNVLSNAVRQATDLVDRIATVPIEKARARAKGEAPQAEWGDVFQHVKALADQGKMDVADAAELLAGWKKMPEGARRKLASVSERIKESVDPTIGVYKSGVARAVEAFNNRNNPLWLAAHRGETKLEGFRAPAISGKAGEAVRGPMLLLQMLDDMSRSMAEATEARVRAARLARAGKGEGNTVEERIQSIIAQPEKYPEVYEAAKAHGNKLLFTREMKELGKIGEAANVIKSFRRTLGVPGMMIAPFVDVPTDLTYTAVMDYNPLSPALGSLRGKSGLALSEAVAQKATGALILGAFLAMAADGKITGMGPVDHKERREWLKNNQPYSVKIGDNWYSLNGVEPIASMMGPAADAVHAKDYAKANEFASYALKAIRENVTNKSSMLGVETALKAWGDPERYGRRFLQQVAMEPLPVVVRDIAHVTDPIYRSTKGGSLGKDIIAAYRANMPVASKSAPPIRGPEGEIQERGGTQFERMFSPFLVKKVGHNKLAEVLRKAYRETSIQTAQMNPKEEEVYAEYNRMLARKLHELEAGGKFKGMKSETILKLVGMLSRKYHAAAMAEVRKMQIARGIKPEVAKKTRARR